MIAAGYEDGNDANDLREDPAFKLALERDPDTGAALCSQYPSSSSFLDPNSVSFDQGACGFDQLTHDRNDGHFGGFASCAQGFVLCLQIGIVAHSHKRRHVEDIAQGFATSTDGMQAWVPTPYVHRVSCIRRRALAAKAINHATNTIVNPLF